MDATDFLNAIYSRPNHFVSSWICCLAKSTVPAMTDISAERGKRIENRSASKRGSHIRIVLHKTIGLLSTYCRRVVAAACVVIVWTTVAAVGVAQAETVPALAAPLHTTGTDRVVYDRNNRPVETGWLQLGRHRPRGEEGLQQVDRHLRARVANPGGPDRQPSCLQRLLQQPQGVGLQLHPTSHLLAQPRARTPSLEQLAQPLRAHLQSGVRQRSEGDRVSGPRSGLRSFSTCTRTSGRPPCTTSPTGTAARDTARVPGCRAGCTPRSTRRRNHPEHRLLQRDELVLPQHPRSDGDPDQAESVAAVRLRLGLPLLRVLLPSGYPDASAVVGADIFNEPWWSYVGGNPPAGQTVASGRREPADGLLHQPRAGHHPGIPAGCCSSRTPQAPTTAPTRAHARRRCSPRSQA